MTTEMKRQFLKQNAPEWTVDVGGTLICPHGHRCEDDQRDGLAECGCVSPMAEAGLI